MNRIAYINPQNPVFPTPHAQSLREDGCVAVSDVLNADLVQAAYMQGIFPWLEDNGWFYWFTQQPRTVLMPQQLHIGRSLRKILRHRAYQVTVNRAFEQVINHCAATERKAQAGTWISPAFVQTYTQLHQQGKAHSFECWYPDSAGSLHLVGGFYGVQIGQVFYGESMFSHENDASKIAFAHAVPYLAQRGIQLIDCQQNSEHMQRFGSQLIPLAEFILLLRKYNKLALSTSLIADTITVQAAWNV